jgi:hypothetical protein
MTSIQQKIDRAAARIPSPPPAPIDHEAIRASIQAKLAALAADPGAFASRGSGAPLSPTAQAIFERLQRISKVHDDSP